MKMWLVRNLKRVLKWIEGEVVDIILDRAKDLVRVQETISAPGTSGEFKRHLVYAQLQKDFPESPKRDLAMAIERAVGEVL